MLPVATRVLVSVIIGGIFCIPSPAAQANQDFERGVSEFRAGSYSSAAVKFASAEAAAPGTTDALLYQARCFVHLEDFAGAERALHNYLSAHHDSADATYLLGFVLHRENRPAESLAAYTKGAALISPTADDLKIVGLDYVLLDDYPDAIKWLEKAIEIDPKNKDAWYYLGRAYYTKFRLPEARKAFLKLLDLEPRNVKAENNLGLIFETEGQTATAIDAYRQAIAWQADNLRPSEQPYVNLGNLLMEQGQIKEALDPLKKAVEVAPGNAYCRVKLGMYYRKTGQLENAQLELEKATHFDPNNAADHYQLGRVYKELHHLDRAKVEFDRAAELRTEASGSSSSPAH